MKTLAFGIAAAALLGGCATRDPMPFASGKDCFYPACFITVDVVDDGSGGKKLKVEADGNVRMGTRHRLVAIAWNLRTPGYEFRADSIAPHTGPSAAPQPAANVAAWQQQILPHGYGYDRYSVTNQNTEPVLLSYEITVYPSFGTPGKPLTLNPTIANDAHQGRERGWLSMK